MVLISLFVTSPFLGVTISSIGYTFLEFFRGYNQYIQWPSEMQFNKMKQYFQLKGLNYLSQVDSYKGYKQLSSREKKDIYLAYQLLVRIFLVEENLKFTERRWSVYWTHFSVRTALWMAFFFALFSTWPFYYEIRTFFEINTIEWTAAVLLLVYVITSEIRMREARSVARKFESMVIDKGLDEELSKAQEKPRSIFGRILGLLENA